MKIVSPDIEKMSFDEWTNYREETIEKLESLGYELLPSVGCSTCDIHNDYVCFDCESSFIYDSMDKEAFIEAYLQNGEAPETLVRHFLQCIDKDKNIPYGEYYTGIADALSIWNQAIKWQLQKEVSHA